MEKLLSKLFEEDGLTVFMWCFTAACVCIILFFVVREIILWYYKINRIVTLLESIDSKLSTSVQPQTYNNQSANPVSSNNMQLDNTNPFQNQNVGDEKMYLDNANTGTESKTNNAGSNSQAYSEVKKDYKGKIKEILTKKYHVSDLFKHRE